MKDWSCKIEKTDKWPNEVYT